MEENSYAERLDTADVDKLFANYTYAFGWLKYYTSVVGFNGREFHSKYPSLKPGENPIDKIGMHILRKEKWFNEVMDRNGNVVWVSGVSDSLAAFVEEKHFITAVRTLKRFINGENLGVLMISLNERSLQSLYEHAVKDYESIFIIDDEGKIISAQNEAILGTSIREKKFYEKISSNYSGYFIDQVDRGKSLITFHKVNKTGWKIIAYTPVDRILGSITNLQNLVLLILMVCTLLSFIVSFYISRRLSIPIKKLYKDMNRVEMGDLAVRCSIRSNDEIGELANKFNNMIGKIQELMDNVVYEQHQKRRAELQSLQSQVNPHFLYNTLASIRFMLGTQQIEAVDSVIVALVRLLKKTLSRESEIIPISEEIENLKNYVLIQKVRQGDKLGVRYEIDENIMDFCTLKLILQPLVENAIFHGLQPKTSGGTITIRGYKEDHTIVLKVIDDGVGIPEEGMEQLLNKEQKSGKFDLFNGIGIKNIHERIVLNFGSQYGLKISGRPDEGTEVEVRIPAFYKQEEVAAAHENSGGR